MKEQNALFSAFRRATYEWLIRQGYSEKDAREVVNGLYAAAQSETYHDWGRVG